MAILSLLALTITGVLTTGEALSGFGDPTVVMVGALFIVGEGLSQTGVTAWIGQRLLAAARGRDLRLLVVIMAGTAVLSAFMSNTGTVATLLPAVVAAAWSVRSSPARHLMALAFAANTGGLLTLTGTPPNLIVAAALEDAGHAPFGFFEFSLVGLPLLAVTVVYMATLGRRLLPRRPTTDEPVDAAGDLAALAEAYSLGSDQFRLRVREASEVVGKSLFEVAFGPRHGAPVLRVEGRETRMDTVLQADDVVVVRTDPENLDTLLATLDLSLLPADEAPAAPGEGYVSAEVGLAEVLLTPRSQYIGKEAVVGEVADRYDVQLLGVRRRGKPLPGRTVTLDFGDSLLVRGAWEDIAKLRDERRDFVVIGTPEAMAREVAGLRPAAAVAVTALVGMVVLLVTGWVAPASATLLAAVTMILGRCVTTREAYRAVSWSSVVLVAAMLPLGQALEKTGGAALVADGMVGAMGDLSPVTLLAGVFLLTSLFSQVISNTATTVLVAPIVLQTAADLGLSPEPFLMIVAVSASSACLTPIATPTNLMVLSPGGYRFVDYLRVGAPLMLLYLVVSLALVPWIWPLAG